MAWRYNGVGEQGTLIGKVENQNLIIMTETAISDNEIGGLLCRGPIGSRFQLWVGPREAKNLVELVLEQAIV